MNSRSHPQTKTVLVIEDDVPTGIYFKTFLSKEGFEVVTETSGAIAIELLKIDSYQKFDLCILDLMLPDYGGYEILKELQIKDHYQYIPIIIVTARILDEGTVQMIKQESNVEYFFEKPINVKQFLDKVHELLGTATQK